jgi:hypothetical protein
MISDEDARATIFMHCVSLLRHGEVPYKWTEYAHMGGDWDR